MGVSVVSSDLIEHYRTYIDIPGLYFEAGDYWKIIVWSKLDFCDKDGASRPEFPQTSVKVSADDIIQEVDLKFLNSATFQWVRCYHKFIIHHQI